MSGCGTSSCAAIGPNGSPPGGGGGAPAVVTLQAALDGQNALAVPTEQAYATTIDLNAGGSWVWRDAANAPLASIADVSGVAIAQAFAITGDISPAALAAGATNDYAPAGIATSSILRLIPNAAGSIVTGLTTGVDGRVLTIYNLSTAASLTLLHDDGASSAAANRFLCPNAQSLVIPPLGNVPIVYDSTSSRWRVLSTVRSSGLFQSTLSSVGAVLSTFQLGVVTNPGDRILIRGLVVSAIFTAGIAAGDVGQIAYAGIVQAQNATTDAQVVVFGPQPWGPPPGISVLQGTSTVYQPPLAFASPGGIAVGIGVIGTALQVACLGTAGFTTRFDLIGEIYLFGTSTRVIP